MTHGWGVLTLRVLDVLETIGPMTCVGVADALDKDRSSVSRILSRLMRPCKRENLPKRIYIIRWVHTHEGSRRYPRAVYAIGAKKNATRPKPDRNAVVRRYKHNRKLRMTCIIPNHPLHSTSR